jgi:hypothetical protein
VSVALFDLGQRLRAATVGQPVARSYFAPVLPPTNPVAVLATGSGENVLVRAADATRQTTASGPTALSALAELRVSLGSELRTLVVPDSDTLSKLLDLAIATDPASAEAGVAAVVGWWAMRACRLDRAAVSCAR